MLKSPPHKAQEVVQGLLNDQLNIRTKTKRVHINHTEGKEDEWTMVSYFIYGGMLLRCRFNYL